MNVKALNAALCSIVEKKNKLAVLNYNDEAYDDVEEELHDLEDEFGEEFGEFIEDALRDVHDEYCPDSDVLLPIAYLANRYEETGDLGKEGKTYDVAADQGVIVDADDYADKVCRIVLVPGPTRIILQIGRVEKKEVWKA